MSSGSSVRKSTRPRKASRSERFSMRKLGSGLSISGATLGQEMRPGPSRRSDEFSPRGPARESAARASGLAPAPGGACPPGLLGLAQLAQGVAQVDADRLGADPGLARDLLVGETV